MLSPAMLPIICVIPLLSMASPAALAHPERVFTTTMLPEESKDVTVSRNIFVNLSEAGASPERLDAYLYLPLEESTLTS